jgi:hypothetical protein
MRNKLDICKPKFFFEPLSEINIERTYKLANGFKKSLVVLVVIFYYPLCVLQFLLYYLTLPFAILNDKLGGI